MSRTAELRERRRALYEEARSTLDEAERDSRDLAGEDLARWEAQMAEVDRLGREIEARERDEETRARLEGNVTEPKVVKASNDAFTEPAVEALRKWKFKPAKKDGEAIAIRVNIPVQFNVD